MILFRDGIMHMVNEDNHFTAYDEVRTAVYDNELPLIKAVGFKTVDRGNPDSVRASDRHNAVLENMIELSVRFSNLILLPRLDPKTNLYSLPSNVINIPETTGQATSSNILFKSGLNIVKALNTDLPLFYALHPIAMRMIVVERTGFIHMEESVEIIKNLYSDMDGFEPTSYFPLNNEFSVVDYIRILPPFDGKYYRYTLRNGMTDNVLNMLWSRKKGAVYA